MPAYPRHEIVADDRVGLYHCIVRCLRRAFLCGDDPVSGKNHDHRKEWIRLRLQELAAVFGIDVCGYAVMSNHFHVVLRVRPDLAQGWSDEEVALRWRLLYRPRDETTGLQTEPGPVGSERRVLAGDGAALWPLVQASRRRTRIAGGRRDALWSSLVPGSVCREDCLSVIVRAAMSD